MASSGRILYQVIDPSRYEETIVFLYDHYLVQEPTGKAVYGSTVPERNTGLDKYLLTSLQLNLSLCAIDEESNKIIGIILCYIADINDPDHVKTYEDYIRDGFTPQLATLFMIDGTLNLKQLLDEHKQTKLFYMFIIGVDGYYCKRGIGTELVKRSMDYAATKHGYSMFAVLCTSYYTQKLYEKLGYQRIKEMKYEDYMFKDEAVYKNVEQPHKSAVSYYKII